jgi:hypothetical protein
MILLCARPAPLLWMTSGTLPHRLATPSQPRLVSILDTWSCSSSSRAPTVGG